jgi:hypothetical protein
MHDVQVVLPILSQSQVAQPGAPKDIAPRVCPICEHDFGRIQERDRHLRNFLPYRLFCPSEGCSWRGDRYDNLKKHWRADHANSGQALPTREHCEIYKSGRFVQLILGQLSTESTAEEACLEVEKRAHELDKVGVWKDLWGRRRTVHCL